MLKFILFFILLLLTVLIFYPIKLKIKIILSEKDLEMFFYKKNIFSLKELIKKKQAQSKSEPCKENKEEEDFSKNKPSKKNIKFPVKKLINILYYNKFKPSLKLSLDITYSTEDAALTAIFYGIIHQLSSFLYVLLDTFFNFKNFSKEINPQFNDINSILFEIEGIITINFAQIIYIGFLYLITQRKYN